MSNEVKTEPATEEQRRQELKDAQRIVSKNWWDWSKVKTDQDYEVVDIKVSSFNEGRLGKCSIFRHACNGFLCISHEQTDGKLLWSIPEDQDVECQGCKKTIGFNLLTFAWMHSRMARL